MEHCLPLEVEVEPDCCSTLAACEERRLAMEGASQQGRSKGFIGPDDLAVSPRIVETTETLWSTRRGAGTFISKKGQNRYAVDGTILW